MSTTAREEIKGRIEAITNEMAWNLDAITKGKETIASYLGKNKSLDRLRGEYVRLLEMLDA